MLYSALQCITLAKLGFLALGAGSELKISRMAYLKQIYVGFKSEKPKKKEKGPLITFIHFPGIYHTVMLGPLFYISYYFAPP